MGKKKELKEKPLSILQCYRMFYQDVPMYKDPREYFELYKFVTFGIVD